MTIGFASPRFLLMLLTGWCTSTAVVVHAANADTAGIAAVSQAWKKAYNAGDVAAVADLYADDAVLSAPGEPVVLGKPAIHRYFVETMAKFARAGLIVNDQPMGDIVTSCDLAWQWQTYEVVDTTGNVVDSGRLVTLLKRTNGKWLIAGDTWNSSGTPARSSP